jgi:hypothetical protein
MKTVSTVFVQRCGRHRLPCDSFKRGAASMSTPDAAGEINNITKQTNFSEILQRTVVGYTATEIPLSSLSTPDFK